MYFFASLITLTLSASSGSQACDALGLCILPLGYNNSEGVVQCPHGMHLVAPPVRSDDFFVGTADYGQNQTDTYTPGELTDIHVRVLHPQKKFLGILIYAVQNDGVIGQEGCAPGLAGCDGSNEVKVGSWEVTNKNFKTNCDGQGLTQADAKVKNYHYSFRWRAPKAGSGDVIFRVVLKVGSTNGGFFYWPMVKGDLMLFEGEPEAKTNWFAGPVQKTCSKICREINHECDRTVELDGSLNFYNKVKHSLSCQQPLLSSCARAPPTRDASGYCWLENRASGLCGDAPKVSLCDSKEASGGSERLCPCIPNPTTTTTTTTTLKPALPRSTSTVEVIHGSDIKSTDGSDIKSSKIKSTETVKSTGKVSPETTESEYSQIIIKAVNRDEPNSGARRNGDGDSGIASMLPMIGGGVFACICLSFACAYYYYRCKSNIPQKEFDHEDQLGSHPKPPSPPKRTPPPPPAHCFRPEGMVSPQTQEMNSMWNQA